MEITNWNGVITLLISGRAPWLAGTSRFTPMEVEQLALRILHFYHPKRKLELDLCGEGQCFWVMCLLGVLFFSWKATLKGNECIVLEDFGIELANHPTWFYTNYCLRILNKKRNMQIYQIWGFVFHSKSWISDDIFEWKYAVLTLGS